MALAETTLSLACGSTDRSVVLASATSIAAGRILQVDGELMQVTKGYVTASTTAPVVRGIGGTAQVAHVVSARVVHGDASDFGGASAGAVAQFGPVGRPRRVVSITATTATLTLPLPGEDLVVVLNGTDAITLTIPVPTKDLDNTRLTFIPGGAAAHVLTFTGGLGGAGSSYDVVTLNGTGPTCFEAIANNELWLPIVAVPMAGTVTNITGTLS